MDTFNRIFRAASAVLVAGLMAGCSAFLAVRALGFEMAWLPVYALALGSGAAVEIGRRRRLWAGIAAIVLAAGFILLLADGMGGIIALVRDFAEKRGLNGEELAAHAAAGRSIALLAALLLGSFFALGMKNGSSVPMMLMILLWVVICGLAANEGLSLWLAVPGLFAAVATFALSADGREGMRPGMLAPAALIVILALLLAPGERITWQPLENAAARLRSIVEDYIRFSEERMTFTINEKGFNRAELIGDSVVALLGGPANPTEDAVMEVQTAEDLLLRGTIKRSYTGYSWIDDQVKARYLYYDFLHSGVRSDVFGADVGEKDANFREVQASVEMLGSGTSTLFVPARMAEFEMSLTDAVYYNSIGEIFLTRDVQAGDHYAFITRVPANDAALLSAAAAVQHENDPGYAEAQAAYSDLPDGIDSRVYALAAEITKDIANPAEKALAIQKYLMENCKYTLDGGYPHLSRDFVSWFLLEEKQGYCSYFASAMAVLCRMNGMPARYVEGYFVHAEEDGSTTVTGRNAHAWVEVYLNGLGWTPFDATARALQHQGGTDDPGNTGDSLAGDGETPFENDDPLENAPSPSPDIGSSADEPEMGADPTPTSTPDPGEDFAGEPNDPTPSPDPNGDFTGDPPENDQNNNTSSEDSPEKPDAQKDKNRAWLWILLAVLLLAVLALAACIWGRKRLLESDPLKLCVATRSGQTAALILYRGILTLLLQIGIAPQSGETPEQFAERAVQAMSNPYYEDFVSELVHSRYSGKSLTRETLEAGRRAYVHFLDNMRPIDRIRYHLKRMLHGIGDLESIP